MISFKSKLIKSFILVSMVSGLFWCTAASAAATPIKIGVFAAKSTIPGADTIKGAELAVSEINANGGINGRQLKLFQYDTQASTTVASRAFQRAVQQDGVVAMTGLFISEVALAMMPWSARLNTPLVIAGAASPKIPKRIGEQPDRYKYVFDGMINAYNFAEVSCAIQKQLFNTTPRLQQYKRIAILAEDALWTQSMIRKLDKCLPKAGADIVDTVVFAPKTRDFTPIYSRIEDSGANVILALVSHAGTRAVVQWQQQKVPALLRGNNSQAGSSKYWDATSGAANGMTSMTPGVNGAAVTKVTPGFFKAFVQRFNEQPSALGYNAYDVIYALAHAIDKANSTNPDKIAKAMEEIEYTGTLGHVDYYGMDGKYPHEVKFNGDPSKGVTWLVFQWHDGKQTIVWPKTVAEGKFWIPPFVPQPQQGN